MAHLLRYGTAVYASILRANPKHDLAHRNALLIYDSNAVYSLIPKNACTTMRLSIARANGIIADNADWEWIHLNNDAFKPSFKELALARYRFTILRCPFARLVSCFLDKIVKRTADATKFIAVAGNVGELGDISFRRFIQELKRPDVLRFNIHWRPQVDFLAYADYDDYFCFESFGEIAPKLRARIGLTLVDARPFAKHDSSHYRIVDTEGSAADMTVASLEAMLAAGSYPKPEKFYDEALMAAVAELYAEDFALYRRQFPGQGLFVDYATLDPWLTAV